MSLFFVKARTKKSAALFLIGGILVQTIAHAEPLFPRSRAKQNTSSLRRVSATQSVTTKSTKLNKKPGSGSAVSTKPVGLASRGNEPELSKSTTARTKSNSGTTGSSVAKSTAATALTWKQRLSASFSSSISGPTLDAMSKLDTIDTQNTLALGYKLDKGWSTSAAFNFGYKPSTDEQPLSLLDPYASIANYSLIERKNYSFGGFLRLYAPVSDAAQSANLITKTRFGLVHDYQVANSRLSLSLYTYAQAYIFGSSRAFNSKRLVLFAEPSISYQIMPSLSASLLYDMDTTSRYDAPVLSFSGANTALCPGLTWSATRWLKVEPSLTLSTGSRVAMDTTTANLAVSAKLP
ncbi:hypothetical protein EBZ37_06150 [bacterium]|nr:hypothetical protein [bacterium]